MQTERWNQKRLKCSWIKKQIELFSPSCIVNISVSACKLKGVNAKVLYWIKTIPDISHGWQHLSERQFPTSPMADNISVKDKSLYLPRLTTFQWMQNKVWKRKKVSKCYWIKRQIELFRIHRSKQPYISLSLIFVSIFSLILNVRVRTVIFCIFLETRSSVNVKISHGGLSQVSLKYQGR